MEQIAYSVGYEMPSSLSKSFKQFYDITPLEYRNNKNFVIMKPVQLNPDLNLKSPKVIDIETKKAIYIRLTGAYSELDFCGACMHKNGTYCEMLFEDYRNIFPSILCF